MSGWAFWAQPLLTRSGLCCHDLGTLMGRLPSCSVTLGPVFTLLPVFFLASHCHFLLLRKLRGRRLPSPSKRAFLLISRARVSQLTLVGGSIWGVKESQR